MTANQRPAFCFARRDLSSSVRNLRLNAQSISDKIHRMASFEAHKLSRITTRPASHTRTPHATRRRVRPLEPPARGTTTEHHGGSRFRPLHAAPRAFRAVEGQGEARHQGEMRARARGVHGKQDRGCRRGGRPQGAPPRGTLLRVQLQGHPPPHQVRAKETRLPRRAIAGTRETRDRPRDAKSSDETRNARTVIARSPRRAPDVLD